MGPKMSYHQAFDNKTFDEIIDWAWGYIVKDALAIIIQQAMSYGADKQKERDEK